MIEYLNNNCKSFCFPHINFWLIWIPDSLQEFMSQNLIYHKMDCLTYWEFTRYETSGIEKEICGSVCVCVC